MATPRLMFTAAMVAAATVAVPATANASIGGSVGNLLSRLPGVATATDPLCADQETSNPFAAWADDSDYVPAPGGSFEDGIGDWDTDGKPTTARDNEPWFVSGDNSDDTAVSLPAGSSITSPSFCGGIDHPTVRLFAKSGASRVPGTALVTVRYTGAHDHLLAALPLGIIRTGSSWSPTDVTATLSGLKLVTGTHLGLTITALTGTVLLDDVYVDPYRRS